MAKFNEKIDIQNLWNYCFDDSEEYVEWFFNTRYEPNNTLVLHENNRICSAMQLLPYEIYLRGKEMATSFLVGVSTWPEDRGKGYVSKLLFKSLEIMRDRGQWISILLPFDYGFYRKYGWETCYSYNLYSGGPYSFLKHIDRVEIEGKITPISLPRDLKVLSECYSAYTKDLNGYVIRDSQVWDRILTDVRIDGGNGYIYQRGDETAGYIFLVNSKDKLFIRTICSKDINGYNEILKFAVNLANVDKQVLWVDKLEDSPFLNIIESNISRQEKPFVMGRIVDVQKAFENIVIACDIDEIVMQVIDPLLEWNDQRYVFKGEGNALSVLPTQRIPDIVVPISTLSQLLWGYLSPKQTIKYGMIDVYDIDKIKSLDSLFPGITPYIYEDY